MKLLFTFTLAQCLFSAGVHVATINAANTGGTATLVTASIAVSAGEDLVAACWAYNSGGASAAPVITDSASGTWSTADKTIASGNLRIAMYHSRNVSATARTVTCTWAATQNVISMTVSRFTGVDVSQADGTGASASGSSTAPSAGSFVTTGSSSLLFTAVCSDDGALTDFTAGSGWTIPANGEVVDGTNFFPGAIEYQLDKTASTYTGNMTQTNNTPWIAISFAYGAPGGGGTFRRITIIQ